MLGQERVTGAMVGKWSGLHGAWGTTGQAGTEGGLGPWPHLQPDWLAMAATLQPEGKMVVARLKHSL